MQKEIVAIELDVKCYHCGDVCLTGIIHSDEKNFCCNGCKTVYEILSESELCNYYELENTPGIRIKTSSYEKFEYMDNQKIVEDILEFRDSQISMVSFYVPQIHCSACLWLLENLYKLNRAIEQSRVNFLEKEVTIHFDHHSISLRQLVELLSSLGYEPSITFDRLDAPKKKKISRRLIYQVGLAGFAFGNIMLLSLPEYFGLNSNSTYDFASLFGWINLILASPVAFYSGSDYFRSSWASIRQNRLNIDIPIVLGILVLYIRSAYEIISKIGPGYFDSLCGLLFFLLLGRIFQEKVYRQLSFERDYRSYFPVSITRLKEHQTNNIPIQEVQIGDRILIRNGELIPVDGLLIKGCANIDNSFATGESRPLQVEIGHKIYAGGRQVGGSIELEVLNSLNQSKLTKLWSQYAEKDNNKATFSRITDKVSQWFTPIILFIALASTAYHWDKGIGIALEVLSSVLIVACPCALALAAPFTFGHAMRWMGRQKCYLKDSSVIEDLAKISTIVFDKTGTMTYTQHHQLSYTGHPLTKEDLMAVWNLCNQSNHPLSRLIREKLGSQQPFRLIENFIELEGKGIEGNQNNVKYRLGSKEWIMGESGPQNGTQVYVEKSGQLMGCFKIDNEYRNGLFPLLKKLGLNYQLHLLSGDNDKEKDFLNQYFTKESALLFNQSPKQKLTMIQNLQQKDQVMMVGDGLNDAGALRQANVGLVVAEDVNSFSPACDIILDATKFNRLHQFLAFAQKSKSIVIVSFIISFLYNAIGLGFAIQGLLSPVFAAILMPLSSISVVGFVSFAVWYSYKFTFR